MPFKFTLLGLEFSNCSSTCEIPKNKMVKKKLTPQQKKFKTAQSKCHSKTTSPKDFGSCMSEALTKKGSKKKPRKLKSTISRKYAKELEKKYGKKIYTKSKSGVRIVD